VSPERLSDGESLAERLFWDRHANPQSVRWFVALYPVLVLAVYRRSPRLLASVLGAVVLNLLVSPPPETDEAWATRVVLGERVWLERGLLSSKRDLGLLCSGAAVQLYTFRAAAKRQRARTVASTVASLVLMGLFFDRMAGLYDATDAVT
jgi:hypothetical protein